MIYVLIKIECISLLNGYCFCMLIPSSMASCCVWDPLTKCGPDACASVCEMMKKFMFKRLCIVFYFESTGYSTRLTSSLVLSQPQ